MDYKYIFGQPVLGGELGYKLNLTSLSRSDASFDPITTLAQTNALCSPLSADPAVKNTSNCLLRGVPGTYSRFSAEVNWKRSITDSFGQIFTPFAYVRADVASMDIRPDPGVANYIDAGEVELRARDADHRHGISLSVHQRAVLGHADDRADRAGHRAAR